MIVDQRVSIVVPVYNERANVAPLLGAVRAVLETLQVAFELVVVDDCSDDGTFELLSELQETFPMLRVIRLSRNFGHQPALLAGMRAATGDAVITMDGDLQHPPEVIPELIESWRAGNQVVHTVRDDVAGRAPLLKRVPSRGFYRLLRWISHIPIRPGMADFRLVDRVALDHVLALDDSALFFRGMFLWVGFDQSFVGYVPRKRPGGGSRYTVRKMARFARDGILSFSAVPLYWSFAIGAFTSLCATAYGLYAIYVRLFRDTAIPGWASLAVLTSFLFGVLFMLLGLIGSYVAASHTELKRRPPYVVRDDLPPRHDPW